MSQSDSNRNPWHDKSWAGEPLAQRASTAYDTLVEKGCDPRLLDGYLRRIVGYPRTKAGIQKRPKPAEAARQLRACARQLRKVSRRVDELRRVWGLWGRLVDARCTHLPEVLSEFADRLSRVRTKGYAHWNLHREALLELLELVKRATGRYHYAEISDLLNASFAYSSLKLGKEMPHDLVYDIDSLKMFVSRQRQVEGRRSGKS